jgi:signal transduction histidine kinase
MSFSYLNQLAENGVDWSNLDRSLLQNKRIRLVNILSIICASIALFSFPFDFFTAPNWMLWQDMIAIVFYLSIIHLNGKGFSKLSRVLFLVGGNLIIGSGVLLLGLQSGLHACFFGLVAFALVLFDYNEKSLLTLTLLIPLVQFFFFIFSNFRLGNYLQTKEVAQLYFIYSAMITFFAIGLCIFFLEKVNAESELALKANRIKSIQSAKMAALGEMSSSLAHEINNPLMGLQLTVSLLNSNSKKEPPSPETIKESIEKINRLINRITRVTRALQTFTRNDERDPLVNASVHSIIIDTLDLCHERFKNSGIELKVFQKNENLHISCHPVQISQVLLNLLNNAYSAVNDLSSAESKWVHLYIEDHDELTIKVVNGGPLIPQEIQEKIFIPFFTSKEPGCGTGLGLSLSKGIIEDHGGSLYLDCKCAHTTFVIKLKRTN